MIVQLALLGGAAALYGAWRRGTSKEADVDRPTLHDILQEAKAVLAEDERTALRAELDPGHLEELEREQKQERRQLIAWGATVGLTLLSARSRALRLAGTAAVLVMSRGVFRKIGIDLRRGEWLTNFVVYAALLLGMVWVGQLTLAALSGLLVDLLLRLSRKVESRSKRQLGSVFSSRPETVWLLRDELEVEVPIQEVQLGDVVVLQAGEVVPVDGVILSGSASIDERLLTGESHPADKDPGDEVLAATMVLTGRVLVRVERTGDDTLTGKLSEVLNETQGYTQDIAARGERLANKVLPVEVGLSALALGTLGAPAAIAVLWSGIGYRMIFYSPLSVLNYLTLFAREGILIKDGRVLESLSEVDVVVFDKTGTLTEDRPTVGAVYPAEGWSVDELVRLAAGAEHRQSHPIAQAIVASAKERGLSAPTPESVDYDIGYGIKVQLEGALVRVGSARFMRREGLPLTEALARRCEEVEGAGHTPIVVSVGEHPAGVLALCPTLRAEAPGLVQDLRERGIETWILSGDREAPTRALAEAVGVDHYLAEALPDEKAALIERLRSEGRFTCFVGDGLNDTLALRSAQVSVSLKGASTAATDTAQIVFMKDSLAPLSVTFQLADGFEETMQRNLLWSFVPGSVNVAGVMLLHFHIATSMALFYAATIGGIANTFTPLLNARVRSEESPVPSTIQGEPTI